MPSVGADKEQRIGVDDRVVGEPPVVEGVGRFQLTDESVERVDRPPGRPRDAGPYVGHRHPVTATVVSVATGAANRLQPQARRCSEVIDTECHRRIGMTLPQTFSTPRAGLFHE